jgi:hypothetical protein
MDRPAGLDRPLDVGLERVEVCREEVGGDPERPADRERLGVVAMSTLARERFEPAVGDDDRRVDEGRVDPQRELGIAGPVAGAGDRAVELVQAADLRPRRGPRSVDDRQVAPERALEPPPRIGPEVGVIGDAGGHQRMCELQEERARPRPEEEHRLTVQGPRLRVGAVEAAELVRVGRGCRRHLRNRGWAAITGPQIPPDPPSPVAPRSAGLIAGADGARDSVSTRRPRADRLTHPVGDAWS